MPATYETAIDEVYGPALTALGPNSATSAFLTYDIDLRWEGKEKTTKPDPTKLWVRCSQQNVTNKQVSMSESVSGPSKRRYEGNGLLFVQLFAPMVDGGMDKLKKVASIVQDAYRGRQTANGVVFSHVRINELPNDGKSYRANVVAEYSYDTIV